MKIWTIQPKSVFERLKEKGVIYCEELQAPDGCEDERAFAWMIKQMESRLSPKPEGSCYPFWAWHTIGGQHKDPDLRQSMFRNLQGEHVCIELQIPENELLLSNLLIWQYVLDNKLFMGSQRFSERRGQLEQLRSYSALSAKQQQTAKEQSWEKMFEVTPPLSEKYPACGNYTQATFWALRLEQVISIRYFNQSKAC